MITKGPWTSTGTLYESRGVEIHTAGIDWVFKVTARSEIQTEIKFIDKVAEGSPIRNMVEVPIEWINRSGDDWYAMRRYDGHVHVRSEFCRRHWRLLATSVLDFLEDLHRGHDLIHLDIKDKNILVSRAQTKFVVADYELVVQPSPDATCTYDADHAWYYMQHGAEWEEPCASWRMDFTMLGYLLARLTWDPANHDWTFTSACEERRTGSGGLALEEILADRAETMAKAHPTVIAYLDRVAALVPWYASTVPAAVVYAELRSVFDPKSLAPCPQNLTADTPT